MAVLLESHLQGIKRFKRGKVREVYEAGEDLLIVASDRISAFDHVLPTGIPRKGEVLTQMSLFWFELLQGVVPHHLITAEVAQYPAELQPFRDEIEVRSMLVKRLQMLPVECVVRGYLAGSGHLEYVKDGTVCGISLPSGLRLGDKLPEPIFTPATKAESGHDENIPFARMEELTSPATAQLARELSLKIYSLASEHAERHGVIIADTKFEFGWDGAVLTLGDEVLTPDSSRFWPSDRWEPGSSPFSYDKQFVRDYLTKIGWNREAPAPPLPEEVAEQTSAKYLEAYHRLTGRTL